jgi:hypothetical protein
MRQRTSCKDAKDRNFTEEHTKVTKTEFFTEDNEGNEGVTAEASLSSGYMPFDLC